MVLYKQVINVLKSSWPKSLPFFNAVGAYFALNAHNKQAEFWATFLKCAPIIGLIIFVVLHGIHLTRSSSHIHKILVALVFSCLGDALLSYNHFVYGMCAFSVAQVCYIMAFGFKPLKPWIGATLYLAGLTTVYVLWNNLDAALLIGLPIYTSLLLTMCWRSIALMFATDETENTLRIICAFASVLFVISDGMIAIDKFYMPINNSSVWIMATYYAAQFGISLSVMDAEKFKQQ